MANEEMVFSAASNPARPRFTPAAYFGEFDFLDGRSPITIDAA
jgi:hypothetical protein